jgi:hypothetical protein
MRFAKVDFPVPDIPVKPMIKALFDIYDSRKVHRQGTLSSLCLGCTLTGMNRRATRNLPIRTDAGSSQQGCGDCGTAVETLAVSTKTAGYDTQTLSLRMFDPSR